MIYANHNFIENIINTQNSKDMSITREMIVSEVAKVIVGKPYEVKKILVGCGVAIEDRPGLKDLVVTVSNNIAKSLCLRKNLAKLIVLNQAVSPSMAADLLPPSPNNNIDLDNGFEDFTKEQAVDVSAEYGTFMNVEGVKPVKPTTGGKVSGDAIVGGITQLVGIGWGIIAGSKAQKESAAQRAHEREMAANNAELMIRQIELQNQLNTAPVQAGVGGTSKLTYILLGVGVIAVIGIVIAMNYKKKKGPVQPQVIKIPKGGDSGQVQPVVIKK